jgi:hypothetical protein
MLKRAARWLVAGILIVGLSAVGLRMDRAAFTVNLIAGLVCVVVALVLGVTVAEAWTRRERERVWRQAQTTTGSRGSLV